MNNPLHPSLRDLNDCGGCAGTGPETPVPILNRPGLSRISFRSGVHSQFLNSLLAALSSKDRPFLAQLRTRDPSDLTPALLDALACLGDVLTFYSERIANESFLRTATERRSILELARAIGYELAPGVSAKVMLTFNIEGAAGAPGTAIIPKGTRAQTIPGPGEKPQPFETSIDFLGRAEWNELRPRLWRPQEIGATEPSFLFLKGTALNLKQGDLLVISKGTLNIARRIKHVALDRAREVTRVDFSDAKPNVPPYVPPPPPTTPLVAFLLPQATSQIWTTWYGSSTALSGKTAKYALHYSGSKKSHVVEYMRQPIQPVVTTRATPAPPAGTAPPLGPNEGVFVLRQRVGCFGHNAPKRNSLPNQDALFGTTYTKDWDSLQRSTTPPVSSVSTIWEDSQATPYNPPPGKSDHQPLRADIYLERPVPEVIPLSWIVLDTTAASDRPYRVAAVSEKSMADFGLSGKATGLALRGSDGTELDEAQRLEQFTTRSTTVYVQSERLELSDLPVEADLESGDLEIPLDRLDFDLVEGQTLTLSGIATEPAGLRWSEPIEIRDLRHGDRVTILTLRKGLTRGYKRTTVVLNANVVPATHGETTREILGSGDATIPFQRFTLKQSPLTYVLPPTGEPLASSLEIWVDDLKWKQVASLFQSGPKDRVFATRHADDGTTTIQFGDGRHGARLPTGRENVRAVYRKGIGLEGVVNERQISLLLTQPLGVKSVVNHSAPEGADNPQTRDEARLNAPRTTLTLDRVVSLQDYEDFSRDYPGVAKAHAVWAWIGRRQGVYLTLLGPGGLPIATGPNDQPAGPLRKAFTRLGNPRTPVQIVSRRPSLFSIAGTVRIDPQRSLAVVSVAVESTLKSSFSFARRQFGQGVALSEVIAVIQAVPGVAFVDLDDTRFEKQTFSVTASGPQMSVVADTEYLGAALPGDGADASKAQPAELIVLDEFSLLQLEYRFSESL